MHLAQLHCCQINSRASAQINTRTPYALLPSINSPRKLTNSSFELIHRDGLQDSTATQCKTLQSRTTCRKQRILHSCTAFTPTLKSVHRSTPGHHVHCCRQTVSLKLAKFVIVNDCKTAQPHTIPPPHFVTQYTHCPAVPHNLQEALHLAALQQDALLSQPLCRQPHISALDTTAFNSHFSWPQLPVAAEHDSHIVYSTGSSDTHNRL
jgi:hypothetical protein